MNLHDKVTATVLTEAGGISRVDGEIVGVTYIVPPRYDVKLCKTGEIKVNMLEGQVVARGKARTGGNVVAIGGR